jgi:hypothetical protein
MSREAALSLASLYQAHGYASGRIANALGCEDTGRGRAQLIFIKAPDQGKMQFVKS